jgi:hypothetical protein
VPCEARLGQTAFRPQQALTAWCPGRRRRVSSPFGLQLGRFRRTSFRPLASVLYWVLSRSPAAPFFVLSLRSSIASFAATTSHVQARTWPLPSLAQHSRWQIILLPCSRAEAAAIGARGPAAWLCCDGRLAMHYPSGSQRQPSGRQRQPSGGRRRRTRYARRRTALVPRPHPLAAAGRQYTQNDCGDATDKPDIPTTPGRC